MSASDLRIAVVGAGMSGIAAAYYLKQRGYSPELIEAADDLGGRAGSVTLDDRNIDIGGKNIGRRYARFRRFVKDHGAPPFEFFGINSSSIRDGRLHTVDSSKKLTSLYHVLQLTGAKDFAKLARLANVVRRSPREGLLGGPYFSELSERHDGRPLSAWFGPRAVDNFLRPITLRMNGAEPGQYYLGCLGSNLKMVLDRYDQLTLGMSDLLRRFAATTQLSLRTRVTRLLWRERRVVGLEVLRDGEREERRYDAVVLALPAHASATLLEGESIAPALQRVKYNPVTLLVARYRRPVFTPQVRALVFELTSPVSNAGSYGRSDLDTVRYTLSGRAAAGIDDSHAPEQVASLAEAELRRFIPVDSDDRVGLVRRHFRHGLCAYGPFHHRFLEDLESWERSVDALSLCGDYVRGASIEACFEAAHEGVERLLARVEQTQATATSAAETSFDSGTHVDRVKNVAPSRAPENAKGTSQWTH